MRQAEFKLNAAQLRLAEFADCDFERELSLRIYRAHRMDEQQLRSEENSDAIIDGVLQAAAEFYGASRASIVEADWERGVGIITHEWCADGVEHQKDIQT